MGRGAVNRLPRLVASSDGLDLFQVSGGRCRALPTSARARTWRAVASAARRFGGSPSATPSARAFPDAASFLSAAVSRKHNHPPRPRAALRLALHLRRFRW